MGNLWKKNPWGFARMVFYGVRTPWNTMRTNPHGFPMGYSVIGSPWKIQALENPWVCTPWYTIGQIPMDFPWILLSHMTQWNYNHSRPHEVHTPWSTTKKQIPMGVVDPYNTMEKQPLQNLHIQRPVDHHGYFMLQTHCINPWNHQHKIQLVNNCTACKIEHEYKSFFIYLYWKQTQSKIVVMIISLFYLVNCDNRFQIQVQHNYCHHSSVSGAGGWLFAG